ncbi:MAG: bacterial transcriptional activator domain-containing protein [Caldilineaceae bacterium]
MQLLAATGQRSVAIARYHQLRHQLADELGPISTETRTLHGVYWCPAGRGTGRQLPAHNGGADPRMTKDVASLDTTPLLPLPRHNLPAPLTPFIGRQQEIPGLYATSGTGKPARHTGGEGGVGRYWPGAIATNRLAEASAKFPECRPLPTAFGLSS